jgi:hypothetical protein
VSSYDRECEGDWALGANDGYYFQFLLHHIIYSRGADAAFEIFSDIDWLLAKWRAAGARSMLTDCEYFGDRGIASSVRNSVLDFSNDVNPGELARVLDTPRARSRLSFIYTGPQKYIRVAGTANVHLPDSLVFASETVGRELARAGFGLISGGWQGVDHIVCREYVTQLRRDQIPSKGRLVHVIRAGTRPDLWKVAAFSGEGDLDMVTGSTSEVWRSVQRADAVVMIGGVGGTYDAYEYAVKSGKAAYPIAGTGGDAARAFNDVVRTAPELRGLERNITSRRDAREVAKLIADMVMADSIRNSKGKNAVPESPPPSQQSKSGATARPQAEKNQFNDDDEISRLEEDEELGGDGGEKEKEKEKEKERESPLIDEEPTESSGEESAERPPPKAKPPKKAAKRTAKKAKKK